MHAFQPMLLEKTLLKMRMKSNRLVIIYVAAASIRYEKRECLSNAAHYTQSAGRLRHPLVKRANDQPVLNPLSDSQKPAGSPDD